MSTWREHPRIPLGAPEHARSRHQDPPAPRVTSGVTGGEPLPEGPRWAREARATHDARYADEVRYADPGPAAAPAEAPERPRKEGRAPKPRKPSRSEQTARHSARKRPGGASGPPPGGLTLREPTGSGCRGPEGPDAARSSEPDAALSPYEPVLDGLFTYCLSVMCEHEAAITALGEALALAERQRARGRVPRDADLHRPWLYALARWTCLRRLEECQGTGRAATAPDLTEADRTRRRAELAALAWPEAAGTAPEQREALELAIRHGLSSREVAAVLSQSTELATSLLAGAACEVERTRAALTVVESGGCPAVTALAGDDRLLLGSALRRELVRHVDECAACRRAAERAMAGVAWPGTAPTTGALAVLDAPRPAVRAAFAVARRARFLHSPRFDRSAFPLDAKERAARRERLRSRAVTTTVVAAVVAAPVLALWAAYRGGPSAGERRDGGAVSASEHEDRSDLDGVPYENAGRADDSASGKRKKSDLSVRVDGREARDADRSAAPRRGRLSVHARQSGPDTLITLTASGSGPVRWSAVSDASWLRLSRSAGELGAGESTIVRVSLVRELEPTGAWAAHVRLGPSGAVVTVRGRGAGSQAPPSEPTSPPEERPTPPPPDEEPPPSEDSSPPPQEPSEPPSSEPPPSSPTHANPAPAPG
ncbi:sigma-70 family RNA polymerase sigma factor [Streptomyces sp. AJS327]|uniref:sigma-70 family RNA polymerase sigma factor n=1 Tax=Streptomyces sp. AJS327 TaxID=2545265 RepID=UPI0015E05D0E|nr:sigma-70 family RNA polymerase sigma factor [Streptomyces sp. AJS327]